MRAAIPPITELVDELKHRLQREHNGHKKPRLQMLYLLASGQVRTRQDVAQLLGVHRNKPRHNFLSAGGELTRPYLVHISSTSPQGRIAGRESFRCIFGVSE
jgi:hypothetical protein